MSNTSGKKWFYAQGQRMKSLGRRLQESPYWASRNEMPYWAWIAFTNGYEGL